MSVRSCGVDTARVAAEPIDAELLAHLETCFGCRRLRAEFAGVRAMLAELPIHRARGSSWAKVQIAQRKKRS